jgi:hypothetical protein
MDSFIDKLRMANIFGGDKPFGMPDLSAGQINPQVIGAILNQITPHQDIEREKDRQLQRDLAGMHGGGRLRNIANNAANPLSQGGVFANTGEVNTTKPMDVIYKPPLSETYQGGLLGLRGAEFGLKSDLGYGKLAQGEEKIQQTGELGKGKLDIAQQGMNIKKGQLDINAFKAMHPNIQITKEQGGNYHGYNPATGQTLDLGPTGTVTEEQRQNLIGKREQANIGARGTESRKTEEVREEGRLKNIGARGAEQRTTNAARQDVRALLPTQERVRQSTAAHQLMNERPDLAQFIAFDPQTGSPQNTADPNSPEFQMINDRLYGKEKDINLPSEKSKKPVSKNNDPAGIR